MKPSIPRGAMLSLAALMFAGCASTPEPQVKREPRIREWKAPCKMQEVDTNKQTGSLYRTGEGTGDALFMDQRAWRACDVLTVKIAERSSAAGSASTEVARQTEASAKIEAFVGLMSKLESLSGRIDSTNLVDAATEYAFKGEGSTRREGSLNASVTVYVREVLSNGNLFVEGSKTILVNQEEQYFYISGVIRQIDISPANSIPSEMIGDVQVEFSGTGDITAATEQGWLSKFFQWVWPF